MTPDQARKQAQMWAQAEKDDPDFALLHYAEIGRLGKVQQLLAERGADINRAEEMRGQTPLHIASERGDKEMVRLLLTLGADARIKDQDGQTPVQVAGAMGSVRTDTAEHKKKKAEIREIFTEVAAARAAQERAAHAALGALQNDVTVPKSVTIRPRRKTPYKPQ